MAQRVEILLTDDLDGRDLPAGKGETVTSALDGNSYEIDLRTKNAAALRRVLAVYIEGRGRSGTGAARRSPARPSVRMLAP